MARYYFLTNSLPTLKLGSPVDITFSQLLELFQLNLSVKDQKLIHTFLTYIDLRNIRAFWMKEPLDPRGSLGEKEIEEALLISDFLPSYVFDFLERYESLKDRLHFFSYLYFHFFQEGVQKKGFLGAFFQEEREIRLIMAALRAKAAKRNVAVELQFEDPKDPLVMQILSQKDIDDYEPPVDYEWLKLIFKENYNHPRNLAKAYLEKRLEMIQELEERFPKFSIDQLLGYMVRLLIVENWNALDAAKAKMIVDSIA